MPARVRLRMACVESIGRLLRTALTTSNSVTFSHLQITFDAILASSGSVPLESFFPTGPILSPLLPILGGYTSIPAFGVMIGARLGLKLLLGGVSRPASCSSLTTSRAIAGDPASPGESMPATWMKFPSFDDGSMIQSPRELLARAPQKAWNVSFGSKYGQSFLHLDKMYSCTVAGDIFRASSLCMSRAVGPKIRLPHSVVCTKTPLPKTGSGQGKMVRLVKCP
mmetsp:Transcript_29787/g.62188  ORF Transcript_29787/g.62188 Transcript_29787/m.62188 type:complete len:224 (+) Transcript_29787:290-961(+)